MRIPVKALRRRWPTIEVPAKAEGRKRAIRLALHHKPFFLGEVGFVDSSAWIAYRDPKGHYNVPGGRLLKVEGIVFLTPALTKEGRRALDGLGIV